MAKLKHRSRYFSLFIASLAIIINVSLILGAYSTLSVQKSSNSLMWFVIMVISFNVMLILAGFHNYKNIFKEAKEDIEANGWHNLRRNLRFLLFLGIISSVIGGLAVVIYLSGLSKSGFWLSQSFDLPLGLSALVVYFRWPMSYTRGFELPFKRVCELLAANRYRLLPDGRLSTKWHGGKVLGKGATKIIITKEYKGHTGIIISTPRGQEERNLSLREAVAAVLEGRSSLSSQAAGLAVDGRDWRGQSTPGDGPPAQDEGDRAACGG